MHDIVKRFVTWSAWGVVSIGLGIAGVYLSWPSKAGLTYIISNAVNVLDVHKPVPGLRVLLNNEEILSDNRNVMFYRIIIKNTGDNNILINNFDDRAPIGLSFNNAKIINTSVQSADTEYLKENVKILDADESSIRFSPVIIDRGSYFVIDAFVLYKVGEVPSVTPIGKVAGIRNIQISDVSSSVDDRNFFQDLFAGGWKGNLFKFLISPLVAFGALLLYGGVGSIVSVLFKTARQKKMENALNSAGLDNEHIRRLLIDAYKRGGKEGLVGVATGLDVAAGVADFPYVVGLIEREIAKSQGQKIDADVDQLLLELDDLSDRFIDHRNVRKSYITRLILGGAIKPIDEGTYSVDASVREKILSIAANLAQYVSSNREVHIVSSRSPTLGGSQDS